MHRAGDPLLSYVRSGERGREREGLFRREREREGGRERECKRKGGREGVGERGMDWEGVWEGQMEVGRERAQRAVLCSRAGWCLSFALAAPASTRALRRSCVCSRKPTPFLYYLLATTTTNQPNLPFPFYLGQWCGRCFRFEGAHKLRLVCRHRCNAMHYYSQAQGQGALQLKYSSQLNIATHIVLNNGPVSTWAPLVPIFRCR